MECPACDSENIKKNGSIHNGRQKYSCKDCGRQFVENPQNKKIPKEIWDIVDRLPLEKIPIAGISRVTGISEPWLRKYVNQKYEDTPRESGITKKKAGWRSNAMRCGHSSEWKQIRYGYGLQLTAIREKLSVCMRDRGIVPAPADYGSRCRRFTASALSVIQISGRHMKKFSRRKGAGLSERKAEKRIISRGSISHWGKEFHAWWGRRCRFPKNWKTISGRFGILFIIIMNHYV